MSRRANEATDDTQVIFYRFPPHVMFLMRRLADPADLWRYED